MYRRVGEPCVFAWAISQEQQEHEKMLSHTVEGRIPLRGRLWATEGYAGKQATPQQYPSPGIHRQRRYSRRRHTTVLIERTHAEHKREGGSLDRLETVIFSHYDGMESFIFYLFIYFEFTFYSTLFQISEP